MNKLLEKRDAAVASMKSILDKAEKENRSRTPEEVAEFTKLEADVKAMNADIEARSTIEVFESRAAPSNPAPAPGRRSQPEDLDVTKDMDKKEKEQYSILRAIRCLSTPGGQLDGLEKRVSDEIAKRSGKSTSGFYYPTGLQTRAVNLTTAAGAINETVDYANFIDLLRKRTVISQLGARFLSNLVGDVKIPKMSGGVTTYWVTEGTAPTEGQVSVGQVPLSLKTVGAWTPITRQLMQQTSLDVEAMVRDDIAKAIAIELDAVALEGTGSGNEPEGIIFNGDVSEVTGAANAYAAMVELETAIAASNADLGSLGYVTSAQGRGKLKTTLKSTGVAGYIWENNEVNGYRAFATNNISTASDETKVIFGNFNDLMIGNWGSLEILVDPYTLSTAGSVRVTGLLGCDVAIRHAESFAYYTLAV